MSLRIAIAVGDVTGIGPEVTLKAVAGGAWDKNISFALIGDVERLRSINRALGLQLDLDGANKSGTSRRIELVEVPNNPVPNSVKAGAPEAARAAVAWVRAGAEGCLRKEFSALVTAPVNKEAIIRAGIPFVGQTELLSEMAGSNRTAMMLLGQDDRGRWLRVVLATTHVPLKLVSAQLTQSKIGVAIDLAAEACSLLGLSRSRVGVCGLNPHAGEGGAMGDEELTTIGPAIEKARAHNIDAVGPLSADALFYYAYRGEYDAVVAMYHDQGLAPLKLIAFERGVNWTLGLPFIRTSPDHGTAYDIAGKHQANPSSMEAAIRLAIQLASRPGGKS